MSDKGDVDESLPDDDDTAIESFADPEDLTETTHVSDVPRRLAQTPAGRPPAPVPRPLGSAPAPRTATPAVTRPSVPQKPSRAPAVPAARASQPPPARPSAPAPPARPSAPPPPLRSPLLPMSSAAPATPAPTTPIAGTGPSLASAPLAKAVLEKKNDVPSVIRIPQGDLLGSAAPVKREREGSLLCEILLRHGSITQEMVDKALALQEEQGGQIGRILVGLGACTEEQIARALIEQLRERKTRGATTDISTAAREHKDVAGLEVLTRPGRTIATLLATDLFSLLLAALVATSVHWFRTYADLGEIDWSAWLVVGPSVGLCVLTFLGLELYSPMAKSTPDEIRDIVFASSLVHLGASLLSTLGDLPIVKWGVFVRGVWWAATLFLVPVVRALVRGKLSVQPWWGIPVCVLGAAKTGRLIVRTLKAQPRSGLKPVMLLDDDPAKHGTLRASYTNEKMDVYSVNAAASQLIGEAQRKELARDLFGSEEPEVGTPISSDHLPSGRTKADGSEEFLGPESKVSAPVTKDSSLFPRGKFAEVDGVPLVGDLTLAPVLAQRLKIPYAVVAMPGVDSAKLLQIVERIGGQFSHLLIIPDLFGFATLGVPAKNLGGILSVEVRQQLLLPGPRLAKRVMDVVLTSIGGLLVLPFLLFIALLIKLDSKGPVFYVQKRLGRDGEHFDAFKFRTMHGDGEERLKAILESDPALRAEYEIYHKLRRDPRVTRVGRMLRKFSLDEFPQLLNVIAGHMSLVGPRPYIERELTEMGGQEKIILRAPPGMTGMWQVSDRNATSFAQRVQIDVYYVRNWSPWLDIHILAKTFGVVIKGSGV